MMTIPPIFLPCPEMPKILPLRVKKVMSLLMLPLAIAGSVLMPSQASSEEKTNAVFTLSENKRLEMAICPDAMNRIAVTNDRITQVFGDEGTFVSQNDEATGQLFLKPTLENGAKDLSLTLITEQGATQDLTLKPTAASAQTIILGQSPQGQGSASRDPVGRDPAGQNSSREAASSPVLSNQDAFDSFPTNDPFPKTLPLQEQLVILLKQILTGQLRETEEEPSQERRTPEGFLVTFEHSWSVGPYRVHAYRVDNKTDVPLELREPDFYEPGDLSLSFDARRLTENRLFPGETVTLYGVSFQPRGAS